MSTINAIIRHIVFMIMAIYGINDMRKMLLTVGHADYKLFVGLYCCQQLKAWWMSKLSN